MNQQSLNQPRLDDDDDDFLNKEITKKRVSLKKVTTKTFEKKDEIYTREE